MYSELATGWADGVESAQRVDGGEMHDYLKKQPWAARLRS